MTPFQALFHRKPPLGLAELGVPEEIANTIQSEDDLVQAVDKVNSRTEEVSIFDYESAGSFSCDPDLPDIYMEEISLPPPTDLRIFHDDNSNNSSQLPPPSPLGESKFPPINSDENS